MTSVTRDAAVRVPPSSGHSIAIWLLVCAALVLAMAVIGAITRLTESGLSMVEWKPLIGVLPPLSDAEWQRVFGLYRETPEFRVHHNWMDLAAFQKIFFWEWFHRLWGHLIGLAFLAPFLWFLARGRIGGRLRGRLIGLLALGGLQGVIGWYMVRSGLIDRPDVSHYRLALHLMTAAAVYALLIATALDLLAPRAQAGPRAAALRGHAALTGALVALTMTWGAFVAGLDAGMVYTTFPTMDGEWIPSAIGTLSPWWLNPLENTAAVQFTHRCLGLITAAVALALVWRINAAGDGGTAQRVALWLGLAMLAQAGLGILTVLTGAALPLAAAHQGMAFAVAGLLTWLWHALRPAR
jgi:heme a synthase